MSGLLRVRGRSTRCGPKRRLDQRLVLDTSRVDGVKRRNTSKRAQVWIKQTDAKGNVYYFNQDTLESAWFPPCMVCMSLEAKKVCFSCEDAGQDGLFYCNECFEKARISASRRCGGAFTPSTRLVSIGRGRWWSLFC